MPITPTYPGVYIEELPSSVRTITTVGTSVTAFVGAAPRGPINKAIRIQNFASYERRFGGLDESSEMSFAVRQFFANGGTEAWVVRVVKKADKSSRDLANDASPAANVLHLEAADAGTSGDRIRVRVDYDTPTPASTFNLSLQLGDPGDVDFAFESFADLSMNEQDPRYVVRVVADESTLVVATRPAGLTAGLKEGTSVSGDLTGVDPLVSATRSQMRIRVNGSNHVVVDLKESDATGANLAAKLTTLCGAIQTQVNNAAAGNVALSGFKCVPDGSKIKMTSGVAGEASSVRVLPGARNDVASTLKLGSANGGVEADGVAAIRPALQPAVGSLTGDKLAAAALDALPSASKRQLMIGVDGEGPDLIDLGDTVSAGAAGALEDKLTDIAKRLQAAVRSKRQAYRNFTATVSKSKDALVLTSGSRGKASRVRVSAAADKSIADDLKLLTNVTAVDGADVALQGGSEEPFTAADATAIIASRDKREGLFALEEIDLFNLLCLPGISAPGVLADAASYCEERRAFLIVDPPNVTTLEDMEKLARGTDLPKSDHAAVFFPWIQIASPLDGRLRPCAPSGAVAGVFARTDAARGVWKAPAGIEATISGVLKTDPRLTDGDSGVLNPIGVNAIRVLPVYGPVVWGARTLRGADAMTSQWKYTPVRRLALMIEESLYRGTQWVVFEGNDEPLWSQIRLNVGAFMHTLFRQGAFQGTTPRDAYHVRCDSDTTTQDDINRGIVNILVGFAPLKPAEFVFVKIQQKAGQIQV